MEQGVFFESLNFAKLKELPVLFLCEDNGLAVHAFKHERQAFSVNQLMDAYSIRFIDVENGEDPYKVKLGAEEAVEYIRREKKPCFLRIKTFRYQEHVGPGLDWDAGYRDIESLEKWKAKDPLLNKRILNTIDVARIDASILDAVCFAEASEFPKAGEILNDVV